LRAKGSPFVAIPRTRKKRLPSGKKKKKANKKKSRIRLSPGKGGSEIRPSVKVSTISEEFLLIGLWKLKNL